MVSEVTPREIAVPCACYIIGSVWQRELITPRTQSLTLPVNPRDLASRSSHSELCVWCVVCVVGFAGRSSPSWRQSARGLQTDPKR